MSRSDLERRLDRLLDRKTYREAERLILGALKQEADSHWLLTRLSATYLEWGRDRQALATSKQAYRLKLRCPLVLWDYANALDMTGQRRRAVRIWKTLLMRGVNRLAWGECGEGLVWARSLINDCRYRIGYSLGQMGQTALGIRYIRSHLAHRRQGVRSVYRKAFVEKRLNELLKRQQTK